MEIFKTKSKQNQDAVALLEDGKLYTPAVNSSYYCTLQLIIYYCYTFCLKEEEYDNVQSEISQAKMSSHAYYASKIVYEIKKSFDRGSAAEFIKVFNRFKAFRNKCDYTKKEFGSVELDDAKKYSRKINIFIKECFENGKCERNYLQ